MIKKKSAGILAYRYTKNVIEVFLVHPGGPFWKNKDAGAWSIPKGEFTDEEEPLAAAKREFLEETGYPVSGNFISLTPAKQKNGKIIYAFAIKTDFETNNMRSNTFEMEWPPKSGRKTEFPEVDKFEWFTLPVAKEKISEGQLPIIHEVAQMLLKG